jgi:glutaredoxin
MNTFFKPLEIGFTIYSKNGCSYCTKVKALLMEKEIFFLDVNCDEYLINNREEFLSFIKEIANKEHRTFPMVFKDGKFIGGFTETREYFDKQLTFGNEDF